MENSSIYIEQGSCYNCFKCLKSCSVKAIKFVDSQASIIDQRCTLCGDCISVCPNDMIKVGNDIIKIKHIIKNNSVIIASISPTWAAEFPNISICSMVEALKLIGFTIVSETALGASKFVELTKQHLANSDGVKISSLCPVVISKIEKYHPSLVPLIVQVAYPVLLHASMLKQMYGNDAKIISISGCIAEKQDMVESNLISATITFNQLKELLMDSGVDINNMQNVETYTFEPYKATDSILYPISGTIFNNTTLSDQRNVQTDVFSYCGQEVDDILSEIETYNWNNSLFVDLLACKDGCLKSPGSCVCGNVINKRLSLYNYNELHAFKDITFKEPEYIYTKTSFCSKSVLDNVPAENMQEILKSLLMDTSKPYSDCGSCGYERCVDFAKAIYNNNAYKEMCVHYNKKLTQDKLSIIIQRMASGVFIVDDQMKIVDVNVNFVSMMGADVRMIYDKDNSMKGVDITHLLPFHKIVASILENGDEIIEKDIQVKERMFKLSLFTIQKHKLVCGIVRNLFHSEVRSDEIIKRTRKVIEDNLDTVQQIAYLLGKNASRTEAILNSIVESQTAYDGQQ